MTQTKLIDEPPLLVLPSLATKIGLTPAIFLQQMHFLTYYSRYPAITHDEKRWLKISRAEMGKEFPFWHTNTLSNIVAKCQDQGFLDSTDSLNGNNFDRTLWYAVNFSAINQATEDTKIVSSTNHHKNGVIEDTKIVCSEDTKIVHSSILETIDSSSSGSSEGQEPRAKKPMNPNPNTDDINLVREFETAFGLFPSAFLISELDDLGKTYGKLSTSTALKIAATAGKRDLRYVTGILIKQQDNGGDSQRSQPPKNGKGKTDIGYMHTAAADAVAEVRARAATGGNDDANITI